jgi:hypothetical protein
MTGGPTVSSSGNDLEAAIVWAVTTDGTVTENSNPGTLRAFSAEDLRWELYSSDAVSGDQLGLITRMAPPVVANGRVYVPTQSNNIAVYGLLCQQDGTAGAEIVSSGLISGKGRNKASYEEFRVTNVGEQPLGGPFALAVDGLAPGVTVSNSTGVTACSEPQGSPFIELEGAPTWLQPAESLIFRVDYAISGNTPVASTPRFLVGSGGH